MKNFLNCSLHWTHYGEQEDYIIISITDIHNERRFLRSYNPAHNLSLPSFSAST